MVALGVVGFIVALLVSVTLHEGGHFVTARMFGMKASKFFVGFGPTVWSVRRGETEYGIKAIPAGGFVKIDGMTPLEEVQPGDEDRAFWKFPARQRCVVLAAGSFMHFVLAIVLVYGIVAVAGTFDDNAPVVGTITTCVPKTAGGQCSDPGSVPAPAAHVLQTGDRIKAVNGVPVHGWDEVVNDIRSSGGKTLSVQVVRAGQELTLALRPVVVTRPSLDDPSQ